MNIDIDLESHTTWGLPDKNDVKGLNVKCTKGLQLHICSTNPISGMQD